jgi:hypothetical protein
MYQEYYDNDNYQDDMNYSPVEEYNWSPNLFSKLASYLKKISLTGCNQIRHYCWNKKIFIRRGRPCQLG